MVAPRTSPERHEGCIGLPLDDVTDRYSQQQTNGSVKDRHGNSRLDARDACTSTTETDETSQSSSPPSENFSHQMALEERVRELEEKLATLSLLLSSQRMMRSTTPPLAITPPASPPPPPEDQGMAPVLDSPAPPERPTLDANGRRKRNLSFRVLHEASPASAFRQTDMENSIVSRRRNFAATDEIFIPQVLDNALPHGTQKLHRKPSDPFSSKTIKEEKLMTKKLDDITSDNDTNEETANNDVKSKWLDYLNSFQESNYDTDKQMEEFVKVPSAVEALLNFGFWICVDSFLYILTILPIRSVWSCLLLLRYTSIRLIKKEVPEGPFRFHRRHSYQLIQVSIIYTIYKFVLMPVSIGMLYHWIRGQAMIKLYVLIAMVEIFDRLMCSLGQDCLDSLYWNTTRRPRSFRMIVSAVVVLVYATVHSLLLFVHLATLNVAMNSDDQALMSLLIGGNFAEIKSTVFKKYNKANLFKIAASDICERFKLALFLTLVLTLNVSQGMDQKTVMSYINMCGIVWFAEWLSDWIKHAFITKFNYISSGIYPEYALLLAGDVTGFGHEGVNLDYSHAVVKRIGFAQIPLVCVLSRYLKEAYKYATYENPPSTLTVVVGSLAAWTVLLLCKLSLGKFLHNMCRAKLESAPEFSKKNASVAKKIN